jgi:2-polyprenyl-3-methyl-5-hydroxy-6-metoxy-1,4-benzoquinol methylase
MIKNSEGSANQSSRVAGLPSIEEQQQFWDWHWRHWRERKIINDWTLKRGEAILKMIGLLPLTQPKILDFGCGKGWFTESLASIGQATGIDLSEEAIAIAKSRAPQVTFFAGNVYDFPLPVQGFDVVVSQEVITHVEDQARYVKRAAEVLKPGGYFIVACANKFVMDRLGNVGWSEQPPQHISRYPTMNDLKNLLRPDFHILRATTILPFGNAGILRLVNSYKLNRLLGLVIPPDRIESLKGRLGFGYQLLVLAQKRG